MDLLWNGNSFSSSLKTPLAPNCHQGSKQSCSEARLDGGGPIAQVGAAAGPGDGVVHIQDGARLVSALGWFYTASFIDVQQADRKLWESRAEFMFGLFIWGYFMQFIGYIVYKHMTIKYYISRQITKNLK